MSINGIYLSTIERYKDKFILGTIEEIMIRLEDDQVSIQTMNGSKNVHDIRDDVEE